MKGPGKVTSPQFEEPVDAFAAACGAIPGPSLQPALDEFDELLAGLPGESDGVAVLFPPVVACPQRGVEPENGKVNQRCTELFHEVEDEGWLSTGRFVKHAEIGVEPGCCESGPGGAMEERIAIAEEGIERVGSRPTKPPPVSEGEVVAQDGEVAAGGPALEAAQFVEGVGCTQAPQQWAEIVRWLAAKGAQHARL